MIILTWSRSTGHLEWANERTGQSLAGYGTFPTIDAAHAHFGGLTGGSGLTITTVP